MQHASKLRVFKDRDVARSCARLAAPHSGLKWVTNVDHVAKSANCWTSVIELTIALGIKMLDNRNQIWLAYCSTSLYEPRCCGIPYNIQLYNEASCLQSLNIVVDSWTAVAEKTICAINCSMLNHVGEWQAIRDYKLMETPIFWYQIKCVKSLIFIVCCKKNMSSLSLWARFNPETESLPWCWLVLGKILTWYEDPRTTNCRSRFCGKMSLRLLVSSRPLDGGCICGQTRPKSGKISWSESWEINWK